jgi:hypothetical protein
VERRCPVPRDDKSAGREQDAGPRERERTRERPPARGGGRPRHRHRLRGRLRERERVGLKENGTLTLEGNAGGVTLAGSSVNGLVNLNANAAPAAGSVTVSGNTIDGSLSCTANAPAPVDGGAVNIVSGTAGGQCAALATRGQPPGR